MESDRQETAFDRATQQQERSINDDRHYDQQNEENILISQVNRILEAPAVRYWAEYAVKYPEKYQEKIKEQFILQHKMMNMAKNGQSLKDLLK